MFVCACVCERERRGGKRERERMYASSDRIALQKGILSLWLGASRCHGSKKTRVNQTSKHGPAEIQSGPTPERERESVCEGSVERGEGRGGEGLCSCRFMFFDLFIFS